MSQKICADLLVYRPNNSLNVYRIEELIEHHLQVLMVWSLYQLGLPGSL